MPRVRTRNPATPAATPTPAEESARISPAIPTQSHAQDRVSVVDLADFHPDPANIRLHPDGNKDAIAASFRRFGPARSIVADGNNIIRAGNGAMEAAKAAGIRKAIVIEPNADELVVVKRSGWSDTEATGYAIADNRATDLSHFDDEGLIKQLEALKLDGVPLSDVGFDDEELEKMIAENTEEFENDGEMLARLNVTIADPTTIVEHADVWRVGDHVLIIAEVLYEHELWASYLQPDSIFCPYPGPFVPLTDKATSSRLVMVQPDAYIAGHLIDRWNEAHTPDGPYAELMQRVSE